jgi:hypothetical protein
MAAPAFGAAGTYRTGASEAAVTIPVPASVASGDVIYAVIYKENTATVTGLPAGFAECADSPVVVTGTQPHNLHVFWKRATGADTGTYDFTWTGATYREAVAISVTGAIASGDPTDVTASAIRTTTASGATPSVSDTSTGPDELVVWVASNFNGGTWSPPGITERVDAGADLTIATTVKTTAGTIGPYSGVCSSGGSSAAWLIAVKGTTVSGATSQPPQRRRLIGALLDM